MVNFVRTCLVCGAQKAPNTQRMGLMGLKKYVSYPFQVIAVDLVGPLPRSKKEKKWILVISCWLTKYTYMIFPMKFKIKICRTNFGRENISCSWSSGSVDL